MNERSVVCTVLHLKILEYSLILVLIFFIFSSYQGKQNSRHHKCIKTSWNTIKPYVWLEFLNRYYPYVIHSKCFVKIIKYNTKKEKYLHVIILAKTNCRVNTTAGKTVVLYTCIVSLFVLFLVFFCYFGELNILKVVIL